jgi:hypothetical protein
MCIIMGIANKHFLDRTICLDKHSKELEARLLTISVILMALKDSGHLEAQPKEGKLMKSLQQA